MPMAHTIIQQPCAIQRYNLQVLQKKKGATQVLRHVNVHRLVRVLYKMRNPHCRQRTGSPPLITLRAPQSPHRYSTPRIMGMAVPPGVVPVAGVVLPGGAVLAMIGIFFDGLIDDGFFDWGSKLSKVGILKKREQGLTVAQALQLEAFQIVATLL